MMKTFNPLLNLPTPPTLLMWNYGSMLGLILTSQILTGLFLTMNYCPYQFMAFSSISYMIQDINWGWVMRFLHSTGASCMMLLIFIHIGRSLMFSNFKNSYTSISGLIILLMSMATAFLGYVLPWGQMSYWGATVITSLASAVPIWGKTLTMWIWGGFSISNSTLNRFFMLHYLMPLIIMLMMLIHLMMLHLKGSTNPLPFKNNLETIQFHPKYSLKDLFPFIVLITMLFILSMLSPYKFMDPENFSIANPLVTPTHIQPEWYFLFSYAILRCIPNKIGGVLALILSIMIIIIPMMKSSLQLNNSFYPMKKMCFWTMTMTLIILMWIGANPVSDPLILLAQYSSIIYISMISYLWYFNLILT